MQKQETPVALADGTTRPFHHRGSHADHGVIEQIFTNRDYDLAALTRGAELQAQFEAMKARGEKPLIVDCGANIGASALWFATAFPGAHVLCVEPDAANFALLRHNTEGLDVEAHCAAIGAVDGIAALVDPGEGEWGYRTRQGEGDIPLLSLAGLIARKKALGFSPFLVKIDIEGGEKELFEQATDWIADVPVLIIELHDWLLPKARTSQPFLRAIAPHDRDFVYWGENIFSLRN